MLRIKKRNLLITALLVFFLSLIHMSMNNIQAAALDPNEYIDSLQYGDSELYDGGTTQLDVTFSEKTANSIQSGDTITLNLPPELTGVNATITLSEYATATITSGQIVIAFNSNVASHTNVRGDFHLNLRANMDNNPNDSQVVDGNLGLNNLPPNNITINKIPAPDVYPFGYKGGSPI
ncbi:Ig-like domain-containing protein [Bombilactobacillus folatiphilus]|uniref:Ig-like domain-containing protein n=1 Tax=Bombilactobacillus folatiphilus TaxID=2923362 RepID=A0ABY4P9Y2_9LACO|nr:Ig-like domain-containing protein [Bombilactobacillus folatiphilus]UQS82420.1 Ig-like domain-containing protein [Bombilactobacillus folatiphilus]